MCQRSSPFNMKRAIVVLQFVIFFTRETVFSAAQPLAPMISADQKTGVYVKGEKVTVTCAVYGDNQGKTFYIVKDGLRSVDAFTRGNTTTFTVTGIDQSGQYQCYYSTFVDGRRLQSYLSQSVQLTVTDPLPPPTITLDQTSGVYLHWETATINCRPSGDGSGWIYFYGDEQREIVRKQFFGNKPATLRIDGSEKRGRYQCKFSKYVGRRFLESQLSGSVTIIIADPLSVPVISLDQSTGVYEVGEEIIITCTATGDQRRKTFYIYRQYRDPINLLTKTDTKKLWLMKSDQGARFLCLYEVSISGRVFESQISETRVITLIDPLSEPMISLDQWTGVYEVGEEITVTCTVTGEQRRKTFHIYKRNRKPFNLLTDTGTKTFSLTRNDEGARFLCLYEVSISGRVFESQISESRVITVIGKLNPPSISLNQVGGVYLKEEIVTLTCTVTGELRDNTFDIYKSDGPTPELSKQNNFARFSAANKEQGGRYQCRYKTTVNGRQLESRLSNTVIVTVADPPSAPEIYLDQSLGVYLEGENVTVTCTVRGKLRNRTISLYKDDQCTREYFTKEISARFVFISSGQGGRYQCLQKLSIKGRRLESQLSKTVTVTIAGKSYALQVGIASAVILILIVAVFGLCFWARGKWRKNEEGRPRTPPDDRTKPPDNQANNETIYATLQMALLRKKRKGSRKDIQGRSQDTTIYAELKL